ncbi:MAG: hypothetical protein TEF_03865 [Rhizobiales bacterium NRL2]|nr:MAG: hypothetical protein TEF_03865 [Rhizobiales bacterium NRL2]
MKKDLTPGSVDEPTVRAMALPTDPLFSSQFNLLNTGQTGGIAGIDLNVTGVWADYTGAGVTVGIIDDGVSHTHADLAANYDASIDNDARGNDGDAMAEGSDAHGTAVAGIIAADDNGFGSVGVAFDATIAGFRMGFGADGTLGQITENLRLQTNVDISNNSWGFGGFFSDNFKSSAFAPHAAALEEAVATGRDGLGTVWVFAAGNSRADGDDVNYHNFQNSRFTIAVAAAEDDGDITFYSTPGAAVITTAPVAAGGGSGGVITTDREGSAGYVSGDFVNGFNGTSAATPMVSGVAALILEANPDLGYRDVQEILAYSSRRIDAGDSGWALNAAGDWNGGGLHVSHDFGFGLTDALAAVRLAESWRDQSILANEFSVGASRSPFLTIANNATVTDTITITDSVDLEWVEVDINIDHSWIGDLVVTLTSPGGTTSTLVDRPGRHTSGFGSGQDDINFVLTSARHWGEDAVGDWTLSISDHYAEDSGRLLSWSLDLYGDPADGDDDYIYTDEYGLFAAGDAQRRSLSDDGGSDRINAAALTGAALIDLTAGAAGSLAGQTFTIADGTVIEDAIAGDGADTLLGNAVANDLNGARGDDVLDGGAGDDTLTGGDGADLFRLTVGEGGDTITDFDVSLDALELDGSGAIRSTDDFVAAGVDGAGGFDVTLDDGAILSLLDVFAAELADLSISFVNAPPENHAPLAAADTASVQEDGSVAIDVLANDSDIDGDSLAVTAAAALHGTVSVAADGRLGYTPDANFSGDDTITYTVSDGELTDEGSVAVTVEAVNDAPLAAADTASLLEDGSVAIDVLANDSDIDGDSLAVTAAAALHGTVSVAADGRLGYTPDANFSGDDTITYTVSDGELTGEGSVAVTVEAVNDAPLAAADTASVQEDGSVAIDVLANDSDIDGDSLAVTAAAALHGTVLIAADGRLGYTPDANFSGDDTITYTVSDGVLTGEGSVAVTVEAVNDSPLAAADTASLLEDGSVAIDVLANDGDVDGDSLTVTAAVALHGAVSVAADGTLAYTPDADFNGDDTITYTVSDGELTDEGSVAVTVEAVNDAPLAAADTASLLEDGSVAIDVLANDSDIDGDSLAVTAAAALHGTVSVAADGRLGYTPDANFSGDDTITYTVSDGELTGEGSVAVTVEAVNDAPLAAADTASVQEDGSVAIDVLANDSDIDGDSLAVTAAAALHGTVLIAADGRLGYTPDANFSGDDTITYTVSDGVLTGEGSVAVTVEAVNDTLYGHPGDDTLYGGAGADYIDGASGADYLSGGDGGDVLYGQAGDDFIDDRGTDLGADILVGGDGHDTIHAHAGNDRAYGGNGDDLIRGFTGNDTLYGDAGADYIDGASGADYLSGGDGGDVLYGQAGDDFIDDRGTDLGADILVGGDGHDTIHAHAGNDRAYGGNGDDLIRGFTGNDTLYGDAGADYIDGASGADYLSGGDGGDVLYGQAGDDFIDDRGTDLGADILVGGDGHDTIHAHAGNDRAYGGNGDDLIRGFTGNDTLYGDAGADYIDGASGADYLSGGDGGDVLYGQAGDDFIDDRGTDLGADILVGGDGHDTIHAHAGNDRAYGGNGDDLIRGFTGNDTLYGDAGADYIDGASGADYLSGGDGGDVLYGQAGDDFIDDRGTDLGADILVGGDGHDTIHAHAGNDRAYGGNGDDLIRGFTGNDTLYGDAGADYIDGASGADYLSGGDGGDVLYGQAGDDFIDDRGTDLGADILVGGDGHDTIHAHAGNDRAYGGNGDDLIRGFTGNDTLYGDAGADYIDGASGADYLSGGDGGDVLYGQAGDDFIDDRGTDLGADILVGGDGHDTIHAHAGNDRAYGGNGDDLIRGFTGNDTLYGDAGADYIDGASGADYLSGGDGGDVLYGQAGDDFIDDRGTDLGADILVGGDGHDTIHAHAGNDRAYGGNGDDLIRGFTGNDTLYGDAGADYIDGGVGSDYIAGGAEDDILTGSLGADIFVFSNSDGATSDDVITDFELGTDKFYLIGLTVAKITDTGADGDMSAGDVFVTFSDDSSVLLLGITGLQESELY